MCQQVAVDKIVSIYLMTNIAIQDVLYNIKTQINIETNNLMSTKTTQSSCRVPDRVAVEYHTE